MGLTAEQSARVPLTLHAMLAALPDLVLVFDNAERIVEYHAPDDGILALPPEAFLGRTLREVMPPDVPSPLSDVLRDGKARDVEYSLPVGPAQVVRYFHARFSSLPGGTGAVAAVRDVTDRVLAEAMLRRERQHLDEAQAMAHLGSWEFDPATKTITWSEELFRIFHIEKVGSGPSFENYIGRIHPEDRGYTLAAIDAATREGTPYQLWHRIVLPNGEIRHLHCRGGVARDAHGRLVSLRGTAHDRTSERQAELELVRAREAALVASRAKSQFLANMSHEIRTPLNGVLGMTALALEGELGNEQRELIQSAHKSGEMLLSIVDDILDLAKVEAGAITLESVAFSAEDMAAEATLAVATNADERQVELVVEVAGGAPVWRLGDPTRFRQVLMNLVGNAVKFTEKGEVEVTLAPGSVEGSLLVAVRDTGIGIPADRLDAIFEPFTQGDGSITRRFGGTGLGLSITRHLLGCMGATLRVDSQAGHGSRFWFELPPCPAEPRSDRLHERLPGIRVLAVDDSATALRSIASTLRARGAFVDVASSANDAFAAIDRSRSAPYHVVVVDAADAVAPAAALNALLRGRVDVPRIALSSVRGVGRSDGSVAVRKPVVARDLVSAVLAVHAHGRSSGTAPSAPGTSHRLGRRVLVAEDNSVNAMLVSKVLAPLGHSIRVVGTGVECVEAFTNGNYDLVLMDVQMPEMDGLEATRRIRAIELVRGGRVPIVALTASVMQGDDAACLEAGMDAYLPKPVLPDALRRTVEEMLGRRAG